VLLAHHPSQKISGELRKSWLEQIHPDCEIHLVPDELDNDSQQWAQWTLKYLGRAPDVVFTSEDYGEPFARFMGCRHVMVDRHRAAVPISGTAVRASPLDHLDWLEPCVRAYFVRRVVLIGAESTGKTTLAQELARHFNTCWVPEYGREYWEKKVVGLPMDGRCRAGRVMSLCRSPQSNNAAKTLLRNPPTSSLSATPTPSRLARGTSGTSAIAAARSTPSAAATSPIYTC
jgi:hypothetical protein